MDIYKKRTIDLMKALKVFTQEEMNAWDHQIPMTQSLFNSCMEKCEKYKIESVAEDLKKNFPSFTK